MGNRSERWALKIGSTFPLINPGLLPGPLQDKITQSKGMKRSSLTLYSGGSGVICGIAKSLIGGGAVGLEKILEKAFGVDIPTVVDLPSWVLLGVGIFSFTNASFQTEYATKTGKPFGSFILEGGYACYNLVKNKIAYPLDKKIKERPKGYLEATLGMEL